MQLCRWEINTGKTPPKRQPEKQRLKLCGQGSCPTLASILCNPGSPTLLCTLTWHHRTVRCTRGHTPSVPLPSTVPAAHTPGCWESFWWELSERHTQGRDSKRSLKTSTHSALANQQNKIKWWQTRKKNQIA